jgi:primosomal protein N' (replication factor Y)
MSAEGRIARVALDVPLPKLFDYRARDATAGDIGRRVRVPFGNKHRVGVILELVPESDVPHDRLRDVDEILRDLPSLSPEWLDLVRFASSYYHRPIGEVVMAALPPYLRGAKPIPASQTLALVLSAAGRDALADLPPRLERRRPLLERLALAPLPEAELPSLDKPSRAALKRLIDTGWVVHEEAARSAPHFLASCSLNEEQQQALESLLSGFSAFGVSLLFGVTGSGKTEVYMHLVARALQEHKQALILVPEIALTPSLEAAFRQRFPGAQLAVQTSAMGETERARGWIAAQAGQADIVLGTRLAVFVPLPRLGVVVVDEEQDGSFKQQEGLRYSGRDLAIVRARSAGVPVLLCSATPCLETFQQALSGRYKMLRLTRRAIELARLPVIRLVDLRKQPTKDGIAEPLAAAISERLARREQSLVFLNRRGYAPVLACPACGWVSGCRRCTAHLVLHLSDRLLRCHHCGLAAPVPSACPDCGEVDLQSFGRGTQRVETTLAERFPDARVLRIDSDTARGKGRLEGLLSQVRNQEADILVGTQILAKGHHMERLTLVGVLNADSGLFSSDYRASERSFAQLQQVAGRAGRADLPGEVLIQTRYPDHPLYQSLVRHDFEGFARAMLEERQQAGFPPFLYEAALRAESRDPEAALRFLGSAIEVAPARSEALTLFDAAPMTLARLGGMDRAQVVAQSASRPELQGFLRGWSERLYGLRAPNVRWHLDVDPSEF